MTHVECDFETRSDIDLKTHGAHVYFESPHAAVLIGSYSIDNGPVKRWERGQPCPTDLREAIKEGAITSAHNCGFEILCFTWLHANAGWPMPRLEQFRCTAATAAAMALPRSLGDLGAALGLDVQKDKEGMRLIRLFSIPRRPKKGEPPGVYWNEPEDFPEDWEKFRSYCDQDVRTEAAADARMISLPDSEQAFWTLTERINHRGIRIDRASAQAALRLADKAKLVLDREMRDVTGGAVTACSQVARLTEWVQAQGVPLGSMAKAEITDLLQADDLPPAVRKALEIRQEAGKTSVSKLKAMLARCSADGRVRGGFIYHQAGTGRTQSVGVNWNNLPRPRREFDTEREAGRLRFDVLFRAFRSEDPDALPFLYGDTLGRPLHLVSDAIRGFIWAAPGHDLIQADYSNIEGNVVAWLAGEDWKLAAIREIAADPKNVPDMYRRTAASILGLTTDIVTKKHWARQAIGKPAELGLSYGGGVMAFHTFAKGYDVKLDPLAPAILEQADEERREKAIKRYENQLKRKDHSTTVLSRDAWIACEIIKLGWRAANSAIAKSWRDLEGAVREAVQNPGQIASAARVDYLVRKGFLWARLPSGRCLAYGSPRLKDQVWARVLCDDGSWSEPEVMERDRAEALEIKGLARIEGVTSAKVTCLGVDGATKKWQRFALYGGLIAENCLSGVTDVLTPYGWKRITDIRPTDKLWDGLEWVAHGGLVYQGSRMTIDVGGVRLTPDHKLWTNYGWIEAANADLRAVEAASPDPEFDRAALRAADRSRLRGRRRKEELVAGPMRLRHDEVVRRFGAPQRPNDELWVPADGAGLPAPQDARDVASCGLRNLAQHDRPLRTAVARGIRTLWWARNSGLRALVSVRDVLGGYGSDLAQGAYAGAAGQQRRVLAGQLRVARPQGASAQQANEQLHQYTQGPADDLRSGRDQRHKLDDAGLPSGRGVAGEAHVRRAGQQPEGYVELVYDLLNAGPRNRFTVRGANGPIIVSNCTQAVARDLLVNGMWKAEAAGYPIIATVYDEIIAEVPRGFGDLREFERLICELPDWAEGIPLMAGGWRGKRYRKE